MNADNVILIGLDGLDWDEIDTWIEDDTLSNLRELRENGTATDLSSTHPPWTPCAWPSLLSGRNPGEHGVFDFFTRDGYNKRLIERPDVDAPYLFEAADAENRTPLVINYPVTHPAPALENGAVVPGYLAREDITFHPEHLREEYESEHGEYVIYPEYGTEDNAVEEYVDVARHRRNVARFLDERYDWNLMAVQFQVTDSIFHDLDDREKIRQILEAVDGFVGDIIDLADDPTVLVASDHGMGDYDWTFYVNSWLEEQGYCETIEGEPQYFGQQKQGVLKGKESSETNLGAAVRLAAKTSSKVGLPPRRIHRALDAVGLAQFVERVLPEDALVAAQNEVVDHPNSTAYQLYFNSLGIHLNVEGRDPDGMVSEDEYETVRSKLIEKLTRVRDPEGNLVFDDVRPCEEVYDGDHLDDAPDISLFPREYRYDVSGSILDTFRRYSHKNHKPDGILLSNRPLDTTDKPEIYDIAPTVAAELGIPIDTRNDGRVLTQQNEDLERVDWDDIASNYSDRESDTDMSNVEDRLADLGYME
ncbi:alkaline phosphatase family protein [Natrinema versiforme]|uniref:Type I phosphodiesterase/nucleotide pyrophosphatase n=1 Tax=Natrinema versiforme JCM 10478 TaxID=1227496 RepID=L9XS80_9EURY|nr:alkaline phosphatase family protein [Natrinema versiforme]ELY63483.1 type I phosphodiesterase/nucleotide pyrophosphatase [Natrinema versiforme JCM 10478]